MTEFDLAAWGRLPGFVRTGQHYGRAPIVEAIIDIRCVNDESADVSLDAIRDLFSENFPLVQPQIEVSAELTFASGGVTATPKPQVSGYVLRSSDERKGLQVSTDRIAYSWLAQYETWDVFYAEAMQCWETFAEAVRPLATTRLGTRFINRIVVPSVAIEIQDYLRTTVQLSNHLPQGLSSYFLQVTLPLENHSSWCQITSATGDAEPGSTALILDIDCWRSGYLSLNGGASRPGGVLHDTLYRLREAKNFVFEASVTDATRGLIL